MAETNKRVKLTCAMPKPEVSWTGDKVCAEKFNLKQLSDFFIENYPKNLSNVEKQKSSESFILHIIKKN